MVNCVHFISPKPKKTSLEAIMFAQVGLKKILNLKTDKMLPKTAQIGLKYLHERPLRGISRIFIFVENKPILQTFLLLDQFGKFVCIVDNLQIAENTM